MPGNSGNGTKRPDHPHPHNPVMRRIPQTKHMKSLFSNKPDPSCHAHRLERERATMKEDEFEAKKLRRKAIAAEARDIQDFARQFALAALEVLVDVAQNEDAKPSDRIAAAQAIMDRAVGKAAITQLNINTNMDTKVEELDAQAIKDRIASALTRVEKITAGASEEGSSEERPINLRNYN